MNFGTLIALIGSFVGSAFAIVRLSLVQGRAASDRLCGVIEGALERQSGAIDRLSADLREGHALLSRFVGREKP